MTETDKNTGDDDTGTSKDKSQADAKTYTQEEVNDMMAKHKGNVEKKFNKKYEGLDREEFNRLKEAEDKATRKKDLDKGNFDKILEEQASKHKAEITQYKSRETEYNINAPVLNAAAKHKAINPEQVRSLLKGDFRLGDNGDVEVVDSEGKVRYNKDKDRLFTVDDRVREFLDSNAHFVSANPATTNSQSNHNASVPGDLDISKLDMKNPEDRVTWETHRKKRGIA